MTQHRAAVPRAEVEALMSDMREHNQEYRRHRAWRRAVAESKETGRPVREEYAQEPPRPVFGWKRARGSPTRSESPLSRFGSESSSSSSSSSFDYPARKAEHQRERERDERKRSRRQALLSEPKAPSRAPANLSFAELLQDFDDYHRDGSKLGLQWGSGNTGALEKTLAAVPAAVFREALAAAWDPKTLEKGWNALNEENLGSWSLDRGNDQDEFTMTFAEFIPQLATVAPDKYAKIMPRLNALMSDDL